MKTNYKLNRGFTLVELLVVIVIIAALAGLTAPMVIRQRKKADQTEAVNNARQVGIAMLEFETEYGSYPDDATAAKVATATGNTAITGTTANKKFQQMISAGIANSETMFYCKTSFTAKPDGVMGNAPDFAKACEAGEAGFAYIADGTNGLTSAGNPSRPIIAAPIIKGATDGTFDKDFYDGKAVILKMDSSVTSLNISLTDKKVQNGGTDLLAPGATTVWGTGVTPTIVAPTPK